MNERVKDIIAFNEEAKCKAVKAERERCAAILSAAKDAAIKNADYPLADNLRDCRDALMAPESDPTPQAVEPEKRPGIHPGTPEYEKLKEWADESPEPAEPEMTIKKMMEKLKNRNTFYWLDDVEKDLAVLVRTQARRDAKLCDSMASEHHSESWNAACEHCRYAILEAADLDA